MAVVKSYRDLQVVASTHHSMESPNIKLRESQVPLEQLKPILEQSQRDGVVFETAEKKLLVLDANQLRLSNGLKVNSDEEIRIGGYSGTIVHVDHKTLSKAGLPSAPRLVNSLLAGPLVAKLGVIVGFMNPGTGLLVGGGFVLARMIGAKVVKNRAPKDQELSQATKTLAHEQSGNFEKLEAQLPPSPTA